jgi:hypothetical protein
MKCREIKYFLLGSENPDEPPADVQAHLAVCNVCQEWQNRLVQIEMNLPFLPVPQTAARSTLLKRIQDSGQWAVGSGEKKQSGQLVVSSGQKAAKGPSSSVPMKADEVGKSSGLTESPGTIPIAVAPQRAGRIRAAVTALRRMEPGLKRFAAGSVAAAILLGVLGWLVFRGPQQQPQMAKRIPPDPDPLLASILQRDLRLAEADKPQERVETLADLAEDLSQEVKTLAPKPEAKDFLQILVKNYRNVVEKGLLEVAKDLPLAGEDTNQVLNKLANRMHQAGREADELAKTKLPDTSKKPLQELSKIAYDADEKLRAFRVEAAVRWDSSGKSRVAVRKERP